MADKTLEQLHAEWCAARDELRAFEQRLGVLLQEMNDKEASDELGLRAREQAVADDDGMSQANSG